MSGRSADPSRASYRPLATIGAIALTTAAWWAFALWPLSDVAPDWLARARATCFGAVGRGLPDAAGWLALALQPALMLGVALTIWGAEIGAALRRLALGARGRAALVVACLAIIAGLGLAASRIATATGLAGEPAWAAEDATPRGERLSRPAPTLRLVDQRGEAFDLAELRGRTVFVTFAFAHCTTACPRIVSDALTARRALPAPGPVIAVVTLDPWRDTPARLPSIAAQWRLTGEDRALSGTITEVTEALEAWEVPRARDAQTGDLVHAALTYVVDAEGRLAYRTRGDAASLIALTGRM